MLATRAAAAETAGQTAVFAGWDGQVRGVLVVADTIKPTSAQAVATLRGMGLRPVLLTGRMSLVDMAAVPGEDPVQVLRLAGAVEDASGHPEPVRGFVRDRLERRLPGYSWHGERGDLRPGQKTCRPPDLRRAACATSAMTSHGHGEPPRPARPRGRGGWSGGWAG
jgi:hypothetical protein